jgi:hypothetical protein
LIVEASIIILQISPYKWSEFIQNDMEDLEDDLEKKGA